MPQFFPSIRLPFTQISGLPPEAQREIRRDFEEIIANITPSPTEFDAIIDSALSASSPGSHRYKNLFELVANENWGPPYTLSVGVLQRRGSRITEPSQSDISGKGDLALYGIAPMQSDANHTGWDWRGLVVGATHQVYYYNLAFESTVINQTIQGGAFAIFTGCFFGNNIIGTNVNGLVSNTAMHFNCRTATALSFTSAAGNNITAKFYSCEFQGDLTITGTPSGLVIVGGAFLQGTLSVGTSSAVVACGLGNLTVSQGGVFHNTGQGGGNLSVTATSVDHVIKGSFNTVTFSGTPGVTVKRVFDGEVGDALDFTGPGHVIATCNGSSFGARPRLRGDHILGHINVQNAAGAFINFNSCTHSSVQVTVGPGTGVGVQGYAFDASSTDNLLIIGGIHSANFTTPSTDSGARNRVITEQGDIYSGGAPPAAAIDFNQSFMLMGG